MIKARYERFRSCLYCLPAFVLVVSACCAPTVLAGEPQWVEVHSPNFSVVTDAGEKRGREVAMRFEQMRGVFGALMTKVNVNIPIPLQIVAFRNTKELRQVAPLFHGKPTQLAGLFQGGSDRSFIMLDMSVENPWTVVFHEYAHQLMNGTMPAGTAPWFEEGFAVYFSSIEVDGKEARVGKISHDDYVVLQQLGTMKIADLFRVQQNSSTYNESGDHRTTFYAESGMLMHYIYDNQLLPKVAAYFDLVEDKHVPVEDAIRQAFGMSAGQFDVALRSYINSGRYKYYAMPTPAGISSNNYTVTPLSAAAGNAVVADIHLHSADYREQAVSEFQDILKSDPKNAAACRGLGYAYLQKQDYSRAAEYFKQASELDSKDPRVHYYSALLLGRESGSRRRCRPADHDQGIRDLHQPGSRFRGFLCAPGICAIGFGRSGQSCHYDAESVGDQPTERDLPVQSGQSLSGKPATGSGNRIAAISPIQRQSRSCVARGGGADAGAAVPRHGEGWNGGI